MKRYILQTLFAVTLPISLFAAEKDYSPADLITGNALIDEELGVSSFYEWSRYDGTDVHSIAGNATINFTGSNFGLLANREARDFSGTINLAAGSSGNILAIGSTGTSNSFGFAYHTSIVGAEGTPASLTVTNASNDIIKGDKTGYNDGFLRFVSGEPLIISNANVTFTGLKLAYLGPTTAYIDVKSNSSLTWDVLSGIYVTDGSKTMPTEKSSTYGLVLKSSDATGSVILGKNPLDETNSYNNLNFSTLKSLSFDSDVPAKISFNHSSGMQLGFATLNIGSRNITFNNVISLATKSFIGENVNSSKVDIKYTNTTAFDGSNLTIKNATVAYNNLSFSKFSLNSETENATIIFNGTTKEGEWTTISGADGNNIITYTNPVTFGFESGNVQFNHRFATNVATFTIGSGAYVKNIATQKNNIMNTLNISSGGTFELAGGLRTANSSISGTLKITGCSSANSNADLFLLALTTGTHTINDGASIIQTTPTDTTDAQNWISGRATVTVKSGLNSIKLANRLEIIKGANIVLESNNAFNIGGSVVDGQFVYNTQDKSTFILGNYTDSTLMGSGDTIFTIKANNDVGSFNFEDAGKLTLKFENGGVLTVGADESLTSFTGELTDDCISLEGNIYQQLKIYDMSSENIYKYFTTSDGSEVILEVAEKMGDVVNAYWVNTVAAVPEPAEWAMILGGFALCAVAYRRHRK